MGGAWPHTPRSLGPCDFLFFRGYVLILEACGVGTSGSHTYTPMESRAFRGPRLPGRDTLSCPGWRRDLRLLLV